MADHNHDDLDIMDVDQAVREVVHGVLQESVFTLRKVDAWAENICEGCLKKLSGMKKNFKYLVTTTLTQRCGGGMHISRSTVLDQDRDLIIKVDYDQSPTIQCVVQVYCIAI